MGLLKALTKEAAWALKQKYEERGPGGRRLYSMMQLADMYGVGETTVYRAIHRVGMYGSLPEIIPEADMPRLVAESQARLMKLLEEPPPAPRRDAVADYMAVAAARQKLPPSPLEGGEGAVETDGSATKRMNEEQALRNPDVMLKEMTDGK